MARHARTRAAERGITGAEMRAVLTTGWRLESKDEYEDEFETWKYVIQGRPSNDDVMVRVDFTIHTSTSVGSHRCCDRRND